MSYAIAVGKEGDHVVLELNDEEGTTIYLAPSDAMLLADALLFAAVAAQHPTTDGGAKH